MDKKRGVRTVFVVLALLSHTTQHVDSTPAHRTGGAFTWLLLLNVIDLKVPKCEIFDPFFFTPINPIWVLGR